jgi:hypothetical protein
MKFLTYAFALVSACLFFGKASAQGERDAGLLKLDRLQLSSAYSRYYGDQQGLNLAPGGLVNTSLEGGLATRYGFGLDGFVAYTNSPFQPVQPQFGLRLRKGEIPLKSKAAIDSSGLVSLEKEYAGLLMKLAEARKTLDSLSFAVPDPELLVPEAPEKPDPDIARKALLEKTDSLRGVISQTERSVTEVKEKIDAASSALQGWKEKKPPLQLEGLEIGRLTFQDRLFNRQALLLNGASVQAGIQGGFFVKALYGKNRMVFISREQQVEAGRVGLGLRRGKTEVEAGLLQVSFASATRWVYAGAEASLKRLRLSTVFYLNAGDKQSYRLFAEAEYRFSESWQLKAHASLADRRPLPAFNVQGLLNLTPSNVFGFSGRYHKKQLDISAGAEQRERYTAGATLLSRNYRLKMKYRYKKQLTFFMMNTLTENSSRSRLLPEMTWKNRFFSSTATASWRLHKKLSATANANVSFSKAEQLAQGFFQQRLSLGLLGNFRRFSLNPSCGLMTNYLGSSFFKELTVYGLGRHFSWNANVYHAGISGLRYGLGGAYARSRLSCSARIQSWMNPQQLLPEQPAAGFYRNLNLNITLNLKLI